MRELNYVGNILMTIFFGTVCLAGILLQTFAPAVILPEIDLTFLGVLVIVSLVLESWIRKKSQIPGIWNILFGGCASGFLPLAAGLILPENFLSLFVSGMILYGVLGFLFWSITQRISWERGVFGALVRNGLLLFLACQAFNGMMIL